MIKVNGFDELVAERVGEFFGNNRPWHRRLWSVGSIRYLREVAEATAAVQQGVLSESAVGRLLKEARNQLGPDLGMGGRDVRQVITSRLNDGIRFGSVEFFELLEITERVAQVYLKNWSSAVQKARPRAEIERAARQIAAHLIDAGFSSRFLHAWWTPFLKDANAHTLADMLSEAHQLVLRSPESFEALLVFTKAPRPQGRVMPSEWSDPRTTSRRLRDEGHAVSGLRIHGGLCLELQARDPWSAAEIALSIAERLCARVRVGTQRDLVLHGHVWFRGHSRPYPLVRERRGVDVSSLDREHKLFVHVTSDQVDDAIEFAGTLDDGSPATAVAGGWAALEAIFVGPGHGRQRAVAADNASAILACSFPRAELTQLAYHHAHAATDGLADQIRAAASNAERAAILASAIQDGSAIEPSATTDRLAYHRMQAVLQQPNGVLGRVRTYAANAFHRLYRQRNLALHWGRVDRETLEASLRTAAPLVGAVLDRVAHARFVENTTPLQLAGRARVSLDLLETCSGPPVTHLLEGQS